MSVVSGEAYGSRSASVDAEQKSTSGGLLLNQWFPALLARVGAWLSDLTGRPFRFRSTVLVVRHSHVLELLSRDLEFQIAPVNASRIAAVNGAFILGMDRGEDLTRERGALYRALRAVDMDALRAGAEDRARLRVDAVSDGSIDVIGEYARPIAAETAMALFGVAGPDPRRFAEVARAIFAHTFLNLSDDKVIERRAVAAGVELRLWLRTEIARRAALPHGAATGGRRDLMGRDLMDGLMDARVTGAALDHDTVRRLLGGMLVGSVDTTASSVAKIVAVIARDRRLAADVAADVEDPDRLRGWCWEALRRWPHNPILLRRAAVSTQIGGTRVAVGDTIVAWTQAAMLDKSVFPGPSGLRPDRPREPYLHFGGGLHPCAGRAVNDFQIPLLVGLLVRRGIGSVKPIRWSGPFPDHLELRFER